MGSDADNVVFLVVDELSLAVADVDVADVVLAVGVVDDLSL